ncbi:hypothetical protein O7622_17245 [Micromonospora sp. WMMD1076]|uniref:hypothetical protein n=1 Tax=Micromonospora sp. WMMD1076 TaxID=3016103 RepID=UPI00249BE0A5|nr:hypothetical protein [Micromonospora sp. WMMD1076]WFF04815.1 hypothetical protein O7622_17245 [Micromonospora sp. WMMD1076]
MKFVIESEGDGTVGFTVVGDDGQVLATGEPCPDKGSALAVVGELMHGLGDACVEDRTEAGAGPVARTRTEIGDDMSDIGRSGIPPV